MESKVQLLKAQTSLPHMVPVRSAAELRLQRRHEVNAGGDDDLRQWLFQRLSALVLPASGNCSSGSSSSPARMNTTFFKL